MLKLSNCLSNKYFTVMKYLEIRKSTLYRRYNSLKRLVLLEICKKKGEYHGLFISWVNDSINDNQSCYFSFYI